MHTVARDVLLAVVVMTALLFLAAPPATAQSAATEPTAAELAEQIRALEREYEARIEALETQLSELESKARVSQAEDASPEPTSRPASDNAFNPAIGVILNGMFSKYSADESEIPDFPSATKASGPGRDSRLDTARSRCRATSTTSSPETSPWVWGFTRVSPPSWRLEEAYIQTLPGAGLPEGMRIKAGRALWTLGYLNEQHRHGDDFADRPLPYRVFLDNAYNDDGAELSLVLPTDLYSEVGAGLFRGDDAPFGGSSNGHKAWSAYARFGGDFGRDSAWRIGAYVLSGEAHERGGGHAHGGDEGGGHGHHEDMHHEDEHDEDELEEDEHHEDEHHEDEHEAEHGHSEFFSKVCSAATRSSTPSTFATLWRRPETLASASLPFRASTSGARKKAPTRWRREGDEEVGESEYFDTTSHGWYAQAIYKFLPRWRIGARYSRLHPSSKMELDHDPTTLATMIDWTNSEFSRLRLQYTRESLAKDEHDDQIILQYIMSLGAHPAQPSEEAR